MATWITQILAAVLLRLHSAESGLAGGVCSVENQHCVFQDNIVSIFNNIYTIDECRDLCKDELDCRYFTYYGSNSYPFTNACIIFSDCLVYDTYAVDNMCFDCKTEDIACFEVNELCSAPVQSYKGDNLIKALPGIQSEGECKALCSSEGQCSFYTYHGLLDHAYPGVCFLLSRLEDPIKPRSANYDQFVTGIADCSANNGGCYLMTAGKNTTSSALMFTDVYDYSRSPTTVIAIGSCTLTVLAVGGGGYGGIGGGGSGYVVWQEIPIHENFMLEVKVGDGGRDSVVQVPYGWGGPGGAGGTIIVEALEGDSGNGDDKGGNGYSGGGGGRGENLGGDGGSDGGNGFSGDGNDPDPGGDGSGLKLSAISVKQFQLSPGKGGAPFDRYGAGGGGVLVDGIGPQERNQGDGQGFGGGGSDGENGKQGMVLLDFY